MKKKIILSISTLLLVPQLSFASYCQYVDCSLLIGVQQGTLIGSLKSSYGAINASMLVTKEGYQTQLDTLKAINKELETRINLLKDSLIRDEEIIFLLKKQNVLQGNKNNIDATSMQ